MSLPYGKYKIEVTKCSSPPSIAVMSALRGWLPEKRMVKHVEAGEASDNCVVASDTNEGAGCRGHADGMGWSVTERCHVDVC